MVEFSSRQTDNIFLIFLRDKLHEMSNPIFYKNKKIQNAICCNFLHVDTNLYDRARMRFMPVVQSGDKGQL